MLKVKTNFPTEGTENQMTDTETKRQNTRGPDLCTCPEWTEAVDEQVGYYVGPIVVTRQMLLENLLDGQYESSTQILAAFAVWLVEHPADDLGSNSLAFWQDYWEDGEDRPGVGTIGEGICEVRDGRDRAWSLGCHLTRCCPTRGGV